MCMLSEQEVNPHGKMKRDQMKSGEGDCVLIKCKEIGLYQYDESSSIIVVY